MAGIIASGSELVLVTSGAITAGRERLDYPQLVGDIPAKQMLSAVGQLRLMALYEQLFNIFDLTIAQVLLTRADLSDRRRYLNSRNTLEALLAQHAVPIINENDTVATEEIRFGDNDNLSAMISSLIEADLLILLTDQPGLFTADPRLDASARLIREVTQDEIPEELWRAAAGKPGELGTGGMSTKLSAANLARRSGATVIIAQGNLTNVLTRLVAGEALGTRFSPTTTALDSRKRYILTGGMVAGSLLIDPGALQAIHSGGSLLPVGVQSVEGRFERGDTVSIFDVDRREIARGLINYSSSELTRIRGLRSNQIEATLGFTYGDEVIHRNNLVML
jgi:glutamate 5-kinase